MVERVLCKHEVVGSIPSGSTTSTAPGHWTGSARSQANEFPLLLRKDGGWVDIVNGGFARACSSPSRADLMKTLSGKYKAQALVSTRMTGP